MDRRQATEGERGHRHDEVADGDVEESGQYEVDRDQGPLRTVP
jgi:hypothetical protein